VRALALHEDVLLIESGIWHTAAVAIRSGNEAFLVDSPILPEELDALPDLFAQAGFPIVGLVATHGDWDHVLGRLAFPDAPLAVAETTAARLKAEPGAAARDLREFDDQWYVKRNSPLSLPGAEALPVPGLLEVGDQELELHPTEGHTADGMAIFAQWCGVLILGDYLSPVEIPMICPGGSISAYKATLLRLRDLVAKATSIVPGHGGLLDPVRADAILNEDLAYLDALEKDGPDASLPIARTTPEQRKIHAANVALTS